MFRLIITAMDRRKDIREFSYSAPLILVQGETFLTIQANWRNGEWRGDAYDGYMVDDIVSIRGVEIEDAEVSV
jgi:hypothetical protein